MANLTWVANAKGSLNLPANWQEGIAPQAGDTGTIGVGVARVIGENSDSIPLNFTLFGGTTVSNTSSTTQSFLSLTDTSVSSSFVLNETLPGGSFQGGTTGPVIRFGLGIHGLVNFAGTINIGAGDAGAFGIDASRYSSNTGEFNNTGTINLTGSGTNYAFANVNVGTEENNSTTGVYANYGTVNISDGIFIARATDVSTSGAATGVSTFNLSNGSYLRFENDIHANTTVNFLDGNNERLLLAPDANNHISFGGTINGFQAGDRIGLFNTAAVGALVYDPTSHTLTVDDTSGNVITTLKVAGNFTTASFSVAQNSNPPSAFSSEYDITIGTSGSTGTVSANLPLFGSVEHSTASGTAAVYALYEGLLGRAPDALGLESFSAALQGGAQLTDVAGAILGSAERGGLVSDPAAYVQSLYTNTLHRTADSTGLSYFTGELSAGVSQATVAVQIASSAEAQQVNAATFQTGVFVPDAIDSAVARLYYGLLGRTPDAGGLQSFEAQVKQAAASGGVNGAVQSLANVANAMLGSSEYGQAHAGQTNAAFVDSLFVGALGRHADAGGAAFYANELSHGVSQAQVALQIAESPEAQVHLVGQIELGSHLA